MIDLVQLWILIVIFTLFTFGMLFITIGLKAEESEGDSDRMPCGHPQSAARYANDDWGGTGYCVECVREAEHANRD